MNKQIGYNYRNFLIKTLSSSCLITALTMGNLFNFSGQVVVRGTAVPDALNQSDTLSLLKGAGLMDSSTSDDRFAGVFLQIQNSALYPNPMLIYNAVAAGQLIRNLYTADITAMDSAFRANYYDSGYSILAWSENIDLSVKLVGNMPTENSWDVLQNTIGETSLAGIALDGNSFAVSLVADYALNSDMSLGVSYTYLSSKRFGDESNVDVTDYTNEFIPIPHKIILDDYWKNVRAESSHHMIAVSGKIQLSDMMMGLRAWGTVGYGFGKNKSQRNISVHYSDISPLLRAKKTSSDKLTELIIAGDGDDSTAIDQSTTVVKDDIDGSFMYGILGASFSFPIMDNLQIIPSLEVSYNNYSIDAYSENESEGSTIPDMNESDISQFLTWAFGISAGELNFDQLHVIAKVPFDFNMDMASGRLNTGFYPMIQMRVLGDDEIPYAVDHASKTELGYDVDIRMGDRAFNPGFGLYLNFVGADTWSMYADYELLVMDNDLNHTARIVFTFSI